MSLLTIDRATLAYDGRTLFQDLSLELQAGQMVGISGKSGGGKTSLLRAILGLTQLQEGAVAVCGNTLSASTVETIRQCTAYLPQELHLNATTVDELLDATLSLRHLSARTKELRQRAFKLCSLMGLDQSQLQSIEATMLSGGQRQRILLSAALASPAPLLLLDEPTSALDTHNANEAAQLILTVCRDEQRAALVVSHSEELLRHCNQVINL